MKINQKWMLFLVASFASFFGIVNTLYNKGTEGKEEVSINQSFDDVNFYKCVVESYNKQFSKEIDYLTVSLSDSDLSVITVVECSGSEKKDIDKVSSVKGLEKMVSLERLDLSYNLIKEIEVSNNINLTYLDISYNELTKIDLSNNNKIKTYIPDSNIVLDEENNFITDLPSTNILSLRLSEGEIIFEPDVTEYSINVSSFENLMVYVQLESSTSKYKIVKDIIADSNVVSIIVIDSEENVKNYTINVVEDNIINQDNIDQLEKEDNKFVPIFIAIICILLFVNVFRIVKKLKNKK